jgi:FkbM family methyltransferase
MMNVRSIRSGARKVVDGLRSLRGVTVGKTRFALPFGPVLDLQEPWMADILGRLLPLFPGPFIDVGVNSGQTLLQLRAQDYSRPYLGFEPNPECVAYVARLIVKNNFCQTEIIPAACASQFGIEKFHFYQDSVFDSSASLVEGFRSKEQLTRTIFVVTAPATASLAAANIKTVGVMKIDVEGFEAEVIEAFEDTISDHRPVLIVEILPVHTRDNLNRMSNVRRIEEFAERNRYKVIRILKSKNGKLEGLKLIEQIDVHSDMALVDYVICPVERMSAVILSTVYMKSKSHCISSSPLLTQSAKAKFTPGQEGGVGPEFFEDVAFDCPDLVGLSDYIWLLAKLARRGILSYCPWCAAVPKSQETSGQDALLTTIFQGRDRKQLIRASAAYCRDVFGVLQ